MSIEVQLLIAVVVLLGNAFFVGAEFGLVSARRSSIELQALNGSKAAKITLAAMEQVSLMLAGAQLGVTVCSLIFGAIGEPLFAHWLQQPFAALGLPEIWIHPLAVAIALTSLTFVHVVLGEMVPKNLALAGPTRAALWLIPPLVVFVKLVRPIVSLLNGIANGCLRLFGLRPRREITSSFSRDEVAGFVKESHNEGLLSRDEEQLLSGALNFDEKNVRSVLLPLEKTMTAPATATAQDIERLSTETGYSRFPLQDRQGNLKGYAHIKDIIDVPIKRYQDRLSHHYIRPLPTIKATTSLRSALFTMQRTGSHLAQVIDSKHRILGVVALEDMLEELVGDIHDETQRVSA